MKSRELQKRLNTTRIIHAKDNLICLASLYVHNLLTLNVDTGYVSYALGDGSKDPELMRLMDGLESLTKEEIKYYWNGADSIENPITVYYVDDKGDVHTAITDSLTFPSVTDDGILMYENTHFETKLAALNYEVRNTESGVNYLTDNVAEKYNAWIAAQKTLSDHSAKLLNLQTQLDQQNKPFNPYVKIWRVAGRSNND